MTSRTGKTGPRKKSGCLPCRSRHTRCDEVFPTCGKCKKAGLKCERQQPVFFQPSGPSKRTAPCSSLGPTLSDASPLSSSPTQEIRQLLLNYQDGIGTWMDIFDRNASFQFELARRATSSDLIRHAICALSARQLALLHLGSNHCLFAAEQHYGRSLALLKAELEENRRDPCLVLPASILLMSYELMSNPGQDYTRHFHGARSFIETLIDAHVPIWSERILRNSYTIFVRHDVDIALANNAVPQLGPAYLDLLEQNLATDIIDEVNLGNRALLTGTRVLHVTRSLDISPETTSSLMWELEHWEQLAKPVIKPWISEDSLLWYPTPAAAAAMQAHLTNRLLMAAHFTKNDNDIQKYAKEIINISLSEVSDSVQVRSLQPLYQAAKRIQNTSLRQRTIEILEDLQRRTGFHTTAKVAALKQIMSQQSASIP